MRLNDAIRLRLEQLMKEHNKSKYQLSCDAGVNPSQLNDFFRGRISYPRIDTLYLLCEGMNITLDDFFRSPLFSIENIEVNDMLD